MTLCVAGWISFNVAFKFLGQMPIDEPPFFWMQGCIGLAALLMASFILTTQRRDDDLRSRREQLMLQLATTLTCGTEWIRKRLRWLLRPTR